jgi:hypothetical protein
MSTTSSRGSEPTDDTTFGELSPCGVSGLLCVLQLSIQHESLLAKFGEPSLDLLAAEETSVRCGVHVEGGDLKLFAHRDEILFHDTFTLDRDFENLLGNQPVLVE